jgi:methionine-gamma-lyase
VVVSDVCYPGTLALAAQTLPRMGIGVSRADLSDEADIRAALRPNTSVIWAETPANPILRLTDLRALAEIAHDAGAVLVVDGTFAPSTITRALDVGADIVVQSLTKYYSGHGDVIAGAAVGDGRHMRGLREEAMGRFGAALSPFNAWLVLRGMATLPLRMEAHSRNARYLAGWLEGHPAVERVHYPGLPSHPQYELACRQMAHPGGMVSVRIRGGEANARRVAERLRIFHYAVSLGHQKSLALYLPTAAMQEGTLRLDAEHLSRYRDWAGDGIFRLSIGLEAPEDLREDLHQALSAALEPAVDALDQPVGGGNR